MFGQLPAHFRTGLSRAHWRVMGALPVIISRMANILMREVVCGNCLRRTQQSLRTLEPVLWLQAVSSEDGTYINYACPACGELTRSSVHSEARTFTEKDSPKLSEDVTLYIVFLKCTSRECESPVILLAPVGKNVSEDQFMTHIRENWTASSAACANGYPPTRPYEGRIWKQLKPKQ